MHLFVFDVDNTLVPADKILPLSTIRSVNERLLKGDAVAIASGRPFSGIAQYLRQFRSGKKFAIAANGAGIYDEKGKVIALNPITVSDFLSLRAHHQDLLAKKAEIYCYTLREVGFFEKAESVSFEGHYNAIPLRDLNKNPLKNDEKLLKAMIAMDPSYVANFVATREEKSHYNILQTASCYVEFMSPLADKAFGVETVRHFLNIEKEDVYCFGDEGNDVLMLENYRGVAMGNAIEACKKVAEFVTLPVERDGVSYALSHFVK